MYPVLQCAFIPFLLLLNCDCITTPRVLRRWRRVTHISSLLVGDLELLLSILQGLRVFVELVLRPLQLLLHLQKFVFMLAVAGEQTQGSVTFTVCSWGV